MDMFPTKIFFVVLLTTALFGAGCSKTDQNTADDFYRNAVLMRQKGDFAAAVIELKNALQKDPEHAQARAELGILYVLLGQGEAATKELERSKELGLDNVEVTVALLRALLLQRSYQRVLYEIVVDEERKDNSDFLILGGEAQLGLQQLSKARDAFNKVLATEPENLAALVGLTMVHLVGGQLESAENLLDKLFVLTPDKNSREYLQAWLLKGELEFRRNDLSAAQKAFETARNFGGDNAAARVGIIRALLAKGEVDAAEVEIDGLKNVNKPLVFYLKAVAARQRNDLESARDALLEVLSEAPNHPPSLLLLGSIHYLNRDLSLAESMLRRYIAIKPDHLPPRKMLGTVLVDLKQPKDALDVMLPALESHPDDAQLTAMVGNAFMRARDFQKATEYLEKAAGMAPDLATIQTRLALGHLAAGSSEKALKALTAAIDLDPAYTQADFLIVLTHLNSRDWDSALKAAQTLAEKQPDNPLPYNLMGVAYEGKKDPALARRQYEKSIEAQKTYRVAWLNLGRLDIANGDLESARKRFDAILEFKPHDPSALTYLAKLDIEAGNFTAARRKLEEAALYDQNSHEARLDLARIYLRERIPGRALEVAQQALKLKPEDPDILLVTAQAQITASRLPESVATLKSASDLHPQIKKIQYMYALALSLVGDQEQSAQVLAKAGQPDGGDLGSMALLGDTLVRNNKPEEAQAIATRMIQAFPDSSSGYVISGDAYFSSENYEEASDAYRRALALTADTGMVIKLWMAVDRSGKSEEAAQILSGWLEKHVDDVAVRNVRARSHLIEGNHAGAIEDYERVLNKQPDNLLALNNLAWLYHGRGNPEGLELAQRAFDLAPKRADVMDTLGWLLVQNGKLEQGLDLLHRAAKQLPRNGDVRYHFASALAKAGETERAKTELNAILLSGRRFAEREDAEKLLAELTR